MAWISTSISSARYWNSSHHIISYYILLPYFHSSFIFFMYFLLCFSYSSFLPSSIPSFSFSSSSPLLSSLLLSSPLFSSVQIVTKGSDILVKVQTPDNMRTLDPTNPLKRNPRRERDRDRARNPEVQQSAVVQ